MNLEPYHNILKQVERALEELGNAERMFGDVEGKYRTHPLAKRFLRLEERLHVLTHENASAMALELQDIQKELAKLEVRLEFPQFSEIDLEMIEREPWS
jgi:hypothetical protein